MLMRSPTSIRVGIDGFNLAMPQGTGVATYARSLAEACRDLGRSIDLVYGLAVPATASRDQRETLFFDALGDVRLRADPVPLTLRRWIRRLSLRPGARDLVEVPVSGRVIRTEMADRVPDCDRLFTLAALFTVGERYFRRFGRLMPVRLPDPPDIMHWTYPVPVRLVGSRNVYTIHDLVPLRLPYLSLEDKRYHETLLRACIAGAAHVLTVSETSRADILRYLPIAPERITNTYQALPARRRPAATPAERAGTLDGVFGLRPDRYFLFFGAIEPKKNVGRLIEAYLSTTIDIPLVIVGPCAWTMPGEARRSEGGLERVPGFAARVRRLGYVSADHLDPLIRGARAVLFPSLYEGFGLPVLEAMAAGTPVLASAQGALPEIAGEAGLLVDPYDVAAIGRALVRLHADDDRRAAMRAAGLSRAQLFGASRYRACIDALHRRLTDSARPAADATPAPDMGRKTLLPVGETM